MYVHVYLPQCIYMYLFLNQVNVKVSGKTALHCAIRAGVASVVELLLELRADMECGVSSTPLSTTTTTTTPALYYLLNSALY